jgi:glycosyltransferase involved in cell wall biosynthesis
MVVVANLIAYKGHADLLDALASAAPRMDTDWRLLLVGRDDGMGEGLKMQAERSGLSGKVVFCGEQAGVAPYLAAADIAILPSHEEGFSNSVLEGMAAGLAMVVTDVGGNAEAVIDGQSGLVVPPHSPDRLAAAIVELARDPVLRERYGEAARLRIVERFELNRAAENLGTLYSALLEARPMPSALAFQPG